MFEELIVDQNPHWVTPISLEGVPREVLDQTKSYLDLPHVISIVGVRRAGKSTLIRQMIPFLINEKGISPKNIFLLNLETPQMSRYKDDVVYLERAYEDYLKLAAPEGTVFCFLDEVHFFAQWQVFVKSHYEKKNVKFIITGSNSRLLSSEFITLLSGRTLAVDVFPFSFMEFVAAKGMEVTDPIRLLKERHRLRAAFDEYLVFGGFPEIAFIAQPNIRKEVLVTYTRNILYQDIAPRFSVKKPAELEGLFFYLASNVASLHSYNGLAKLVGLSDKTIKEYLSYFAEACLLFTADSFDFSVKRQINSPKKVYAVDTGMCAASAFNVSQNTGHYLENLVFLGLKRQGKEVFYYKTGNGLEVDFACASGGKVHELIQVARDLRTERVRKREMRALLKALEETGLEQGTIVTYDEEDEIHEAGRKVYVTPAYKFLSGGKRP